MKWPVVVGVAAAALVVGGVLAWTTIRRDGEFQRLIAAGDAALAADQTSTAIEAFSGAVALKTDSMLAYLKRGDTYRRRGELPAALRDLRQAAALEPTAPRPAELLGDVNAAMGRYERALEDYRRFLTLDDRSARVQYKLALTHYRAGRGAQAIEPLRAALAIEPRLPEAHYLLGLALRDGGRPQDALTALRRAVQLNPALAPAREALVDLYAGLGRYRESVEQLEALAALEPGNAPRTVRVASAYARLGRIEAAIVTLGRAIERYPDDPIVYTALGRVWLDTGADPFAVRKALEALRPAAERPDATSETLTLYGRAQYLGGSFAAAERTLQRAVTRTPVDPLAYRYLADTATRLRRPQAAREADLKYAALTGR
jgi:tetratricopeptide (TPR) repeat protein